VIVEADLIGNRHVAGRFDIASERNHALSREAAIAAGEVREQAA